MIIHIGAVGVQTNNIEPIKVDAIIKNVLETTNVAKTGDIVVTGPYREKYVVKVTKLPGLYNLIDDVLYTRDVTRKVAKVTRSMIKKLKLPNELEFMTSWGEIMILQPGDILVQDGEHYYRIEKTIFTKTYIIQP